jgi:hypothetical protein
LSKIELALVVLSMGTLTAILFFSPTDSPLVKYNYWPTWSPRTEAIVNWCGMTLGLPKPILTPNFQTAKSWSYSALTAAAPPIYGMIISPKLVKSGIRRSDMELQSLGLWGSEGQEMAELLVS